MHKRWYLHSSLLLVFVVVQYDMNGWLGCTMAVDAEAHLPSSSFSFSEPRDMLEVDSSGIVSHR